MLIRDERNDMLFEAEEKDEDAFYDFLDKHDSFYFAHNEFAEKLETYIKNHPEKFTFNGSYEKYVFD